MAKSGNEVSAASRKTRLRRNTKGQSTVELAVCFPVLMIVALTAYNLVFYLSAAARFYPLAAEAVRTQATSPGYGEFSQAARAALIEECLKEAMGDGYSVTISVSVQSVSYGNLGAAGNGDNSIVLSLLPKHEQITCTMEFQLIGVPKSIFGVSLPSITSQRTFVIDPYRPGGFF